MSLLERVHPPCLPLLQRGLYVLLLLQDASDAQDSLPSLLCFDVADHVRRRADIFYEHAILAVPSYELVRVLSVGPILLHQ